MSNLNLYRHKARRVTSRCFVAALCNAAKFDSQNSAQSLFQIAPRAWHGTSLQAAQIGVAHLGMCCCATRVWRGRQRLVSGLLQFQRFFFCLLLQLFHQQPGLFCCMKGCYVSD